MKKIFNFYNYMPSWSKILGQAVIKIITISFGDALKILNVNSSLKTLSTTEKNQLFVQKVKQELSKIASSGQYCGEDISDEQWQSIRSRTKQGDGFFHKRLEREIGKDAKEVFDLMYRQKYRQISDDKATFSTFSESTRMFLDNPEQRTILIEAAKKIENMSYLLAEEYLLYRYLARSILYHDDSNSLTEEVALNQENQSLSIFGEEYLQEKKIHLDYLQYVVALKSSVKKIEQVNKKFKSEHPYVAFLLDTSDAVNNHAGKIAASYVALVSAVIYLRYQVIDEDSKWYELVALPSTALAMLQIASSFPRTVLSNLQTQSMNNNIFKSLSKDMEQSTIKDIEFLFHNTPAFANTVNIVSSCFRCVANLLLQPIDLVKSDLKDVILGYSALRWVTPAGVIEEQGKVAGFVNGKLNQFLYTNIVPALRSNNDQGTDQHINNYFHLLYQNILGEKDSPEKLEKMHRLKEICSKCSPNLVYENIEWSGSKYSKWQKITNGVALTTLMLEYIFAYYRDNDIDYYTDPAFYCGTIVKFMRLSSLLASTWCANKITENVTGETLNNNIPFQDCYYNNIARLGAAVIPLLIFESTNDIKILSLATLIDVLTTVKADGKSGEAISIFNRLNTEQLVITLNPIPPEEDQLLGVTTVD